MNISVTGPHILIFERDPQLSALIHNELQRANYMCHIARTAVEVFDAIARFPIRLVLINLAQAAASRREFWVALDTQRRGSGIQVFTFHCTNLASYGPRESEDYGQASMADMEIDGTLGLMRLVDTVRARVPGIEATSTTMPRIPRTSNNPSPPSRQDSQNSANARSKLAAQSPLYTTPSPALPNLPVTSPATQLPAGSQISYSDKIRAVLYPTPHTGTWQASGNSVRETAPESETLKSSTAVSANPAQTLPSGISMLQRLANGQMYSSPGLAELSRLVQEHQPSVKEEASSVRDPWVVDGLRPSPMASAVIVPPNEQQLPFPPNPALNEPSAMIFTALEERDPTHASQNESALSFSHEKEHQLRAAPIQDLPSQRSATSYPLATESSMPMPQEALSQAPLASIVTPSPLQTASSHVSPFNREHEPRPLLETDTVPLPVELPYAREEARSRHVADHGQKHLYSGKQQKESDSSTEARNAVILDILQSLPAMTTPSSQQEQAVQPQIHHGRATRSLGNVLLDGHLVPQDRLEVAQNIQRMLRGVDMNYQLGEILLMFKLLTPDQLLAASLVGYGLITRTQVSALGRIRQELHAIGLEYDLENLVILFRILTPEQLREARSSVLG